MPEYANPNVDIVSAILSPLEMLFDIRFWACGCIVWAIGMLSLIAFGVWLGGMWHG